MRIDWLDKFRYFLQTLAFCLAIGAIQQAFQPDRPYEVPLVYSVSIGVSSWLFIDFGRHLFRSAAETGWPAGYQGVLLCLIGTLGGYALGTLIADGWFGWSSWDAHGRAQLPLSILITVLAGIAVTYYFYTRSRATFFQNRMKEASRQAGEARLKLLEAQLEPHMLFNTLANLRALIGIDAVRAQTMVDHLNGYLRATLSGSRATWHPLATEFARLDDYLQLMVIRMGARLHFTLTLPDELRAVPVPPLLLQPLVENAIRHGLEPRVQGGHITVRALPDGDWLQLEMADTGVGFDPSARPANDGGSHFGLTQVRERVAAAYEGRGQVTLTSKPGEGTTIRLRLPLAPALAQPDTAPINRTAA